jgi:hypothetical protein
LPAGRTPTGGSIYLISFKNCNRIHVFLLPAGPLPGALVNKKYLKKINYLFFLFLLILTAYHFSIFHFSIFHFPFSTFHLPRFHFPLLNLSAYSELPSQKSICYPQKNIFYENGYFEFSVIPNQRP